MEQDITRFLNEMEQKYGKIADRYSLENYLHNAIAGDIVATKSISRDDFAVRLKDASGWKSYEPHEDMIDEAINLFEEENGSRNFCDFTDSEVYSIDSACRKALEKCACALKVIHRYSEETAHEDVFFEESAEGHSSYIECQLMVNEPKDRKYEICGNTLVCEREIWNEVSGHVLGTKTVSYTLYDTDGNEIPYDWKAVLPERSVA